MVLFLFVKLVSEFLKSVTVDENEYEDNHGKDVANQIQGKLIRKILNRMSSMLYLKTITL